ncbi:MAG: bifunctional fucokinase/L-fucose-1-P-guanylyltransferase, partial [Paramuribaculum sp.]|nr:bifunctional fucokinase/L-fucose-1-P-guanylyltransferase [Paramuribaculum sp.]
SDRAVHLLMKRSKSGDEIKFYDLYSDFGRALGTNPAIKDDEINSLTVAILPLPGGEFYHFGTTRELLSSTVALQNLVLDQRKILHNKIKANPSLFVQNVDMGYKLGTANDNVWVENSNVPASWTLTSNHVITGVPVNDWTLELPSGVCLDIVPVEDTKYALRPYGYNDAMRGPLTDLSTEWMGMPFKAWATERGLDVDSTQSDIQAAPIFPIADSLEVAGKMLRWMISEPEYKEGAELYKAARKISADEISAMANLERLYSQREAFRKGNWSLLAKNHERSVFYQLDLDDTAKAYSALNIEKPAVLPVELPAMTRIRNLMLRSRIDMRNGEDGTADETAAFALLREEMLKTFEAAVPKPRINVYSDQIVWARSPVRIDLAGGWTDTPPYSLFAGGNVVNLAIELNGQPPLQVYVKPTDNYKVILRSIDLGAVEEVTDYDTLYKFNKVGSPFSIPKAALVLAGFSRLSAPTLVEQLKQFGAGIEITLLSAIPAGSGLGTSAILAATVLGALSDFAGLAWDENEICSRTLALEQLLTTGGGWQDQYGGVLGGVKLLQTEDGYDQRPLVSWLPDRLFTTPEYSRCHVLYYTGLTRTAKNILSEIVRGMFLNSGERLELLDEMKDHALQMADAIQRNNFELYGKLVARTWNQNKLLDSGTETEAVAQIINRIKDYTLGYKLPGAGGGGYLYMVAKDPEAAARIRTELTATPPNSKARFVDMTVSQSGFKVSRS